MVHRKLMTCSMIPSTLNVTSLFIHKGVCSYTNWRGYLCPYTSPRGHVLWLLKAWPHVRAPPLTSHVTFSKLLTHFYVLTSWSVKQDHCGNHPDTIVVGSNKDNEHQVWSIAPCMWSTLHKCWWFFFPSQENGIYCSNHFDKNKTEKLWSHPCISFFFML